MKERPIGAAAFDPRSKLPDSLCPAEVPDTDSAPEPARASSADLDDTPSPTTSHARQAQGDCRTAEPQGRSLARRYRARDHNVGLATLVNRSGVDRTRQQSGHGRRMLVNE